MWKNDIEILEERKGWNGKTVADLNDKNFLITGSKNSNLWKVIKYIIDVQVAVH